MRPDFAMIFYEDGSKRETGLRGKIDWSSQASSYAMGEGNLSPATMKGQIVDELTGSTVLVIDDGRRPVRAVRVNAYDICEAWWCDGNWR